jgi:hypothetical protein
MHTAAARCVEPRHLQLHRGLRSALDLLQLQIAALYALFI